MLNARVRGFTLVELLVTLAVLAVAAMLAAPGAGNMMASRKVQGAAQSILDGITQARTEALRRNTQVRFEITGGGTGWTITQVSSGTVLRSFSSADWSRLVLDSAGSATGATFLANGLLQAGTQLSQVTVSSPANDKAVRRVNVFGGGLIRLCDPTITVADDPRRC